ncbi:MAG: orotidine-5'-phosphate decarboxylase [Chitinispirillales bacterium]|jgi:orotidine-5'-phosphate decarboxylase|nr:orotidine-5'-phosphate decarboxylase [Chitinispirillales bacterium]
MTAKTAKDYIALALDNTGDADVLKGFIVDTAEYVGVYKLGLEQFTRFGPKILDSVRGADRKIFLDLKFHDIPNTVEKAVRAACEHGADYLTIHTQGGVEMMIAASVATARAAHRPKILGVTLLTSIDQTMLNGDLGVPLPTGKYVLHLAQKAVIAGIDGLVCSAADLEMIKPAIPHDFDIVTPGIRPAGADADDQKRVATPEWAVKNGATLLVIGRPITGAASPKKAAEDIAKRVESAL